jgi:hypothetical protein
VPVAAALASARYRKGIPAPARSLGPDILVQKFIGRPMKRDAYDTDLAIKVDTKQVAAPRPGKPSSRCGARTAA